MLKLACRCTVLFILCAPVLMGRGDIIVEVKGEGFFPSNCLFKNIYGSVAGGVGLEATFQVCEESNWNAFISADFISKKGCSIGLANPTKVHIIPLGFGLKYFWNVCDSSNVYLGLGLQPVNLRTNNCSPFVAQCTSKWGMGGIAKAGVYIDVYCDWVLDLFVDYSFSHVGCSTDCTSPLTVVPLKPRVNGALVGAGLGYRF